MATENEKKKEEFIIKEKPAPRPKLFTEVLDLCLVEYERYLILRAMEHRRTVTVNIYWQQNEARRQKDTALVKIKGVILQFDNVRTLFAKQA